MVGTNHPELVREFASDLTPSSFFDNPIGSSVLMRPMDVVKPPQNQLNKTTPDARLPAPKCEVKHLRVPFENTSVRLSTVTVTQPSLPASWPRLKGVVNANAYYNPLLPNLFFRFRCQLYMVHTSMDKPLIFLREMVCLFFNSMVVDPSLTPVQAGMRVWSVVDVVIEEPLHDKDSQSEGDARWRDYSDTTKYSPDFVLTNDAMQEVTYLKLLLGGRFIGV